MTQDALPSFALMREKLFTAVLSDTLDAAGHTRQALPSRIRPLDEASVMVGRARTGFYMDVFEVLPGENPYELEIRLVDDLKPGEVCVLGCGRSQRTAPWGELLSTAANARGAVGCLTDGYVRDIKAIKAMGFPVFHGGIGPLDTKGRAKVMAIDVPIEVAGVAVSPGDLVFGDADGTVVIPRAVEREVIAAALRKVEGEDKSRDALREGAYLRDVFAKYGIL